eukprot:9007636-Heterocapsa_arctica.AAC.1
MAIHAPLSPSCRRCAGTGTLLPASTVTRPCPGAPRPRRGPRDHSCGLVVRLWTRRLQGCQRGWPRGR